MRCEVPPDRRGGRRTQTGRSAARNPGSARSGKPSSRASSRSCRSWASTSWRHGFTRLCGPSSPPAAQPSAPMTFSSARRRSLWAMTSQRMTVGVSKDSGLEGPRLVVGVRRRPSRPAQVPARAPASGLRRPTPASQIEAANAKAGVHRRSTGSADRGFIVHPRRARLLRALHMAPAVASRRRGD